MSGGLTEVIDMKISIITINRNNAQGLEATISSVLAQTFLEYEYVIVDGASTDASVDVIRRMADGRNNVKWVSEPDAGIYNAMNKGVAMATGDYLLFLNSGDKFSGCDVLSVCSDHLCGSDFVMGRVNVVHDGLVVCQTKVLEESDLSLFYLYLQGIPHQAAFISRQLLVDNPYDESLKINSDWKFFVQSVVCDNASVEFLPYVIADYDDAGVSSINGKLLNRERELVFKSLFPERIVSDYLAVLPNYYEVKRVKWLLAHPFFYRVYRLWTSFGIRLLG